MSVALHAAEAGPVPVEALEWFRRKGLRPGFSFEDVWREEHAFAFTAAKVMREDVLEAMRDELGRALEEGHTFEQFRKTIEERLVALGWWGKQPVHDPVTGRVVEVNVPSRLARIFETNMRTARAAGQWQRIERTKRTHPFLVYLNGPSREHRPEHVEWAGTALSVDDPWWDTHFPPNGWGCKCWVRQVSERTLERLRETGIRGSDGTIIPIRETAPAIRLVSYVNKRTGATHEAPEGIDPGWEYNVGKVRQAADGSKPPPSFPFSPDDLVEVPGVRLGGMHAKTVYRAPDGSQWIFKPQEDFRALGDVAAARIAEALERETAEVYLVEIGGRRGSIQRMFADVAGPIGDTPPTSLTPAQARTIQEEHIFDWLISQHDTHNENILQLANGELRFIDKGQLFRFFGRDRFDLEYGAAGTPNPSGTYYHDVFTAYARGEDVPLVPRDGLDALVSRIEGLNDDEFLDLLRPYARAAVEAAEGNPAMRRAAWMGRYTEEEFLRAALERKNAIRSTVDEFYAELEAQRTRVLGPPEVRARRQRWAERLDEARDPNIPGWRGRSFFVRGPDYESMNWLMYRTEGDGTFLETKLREDGHRRLMDVVHRATGTMDDPFHSRVLTIAKSFNYHLKTGGDGVIPAHTESAFSGVLTELRDAATHGDSAYRAMAQHYLDYLEALGGPGAWKHEAVGRTVEKYAPPERDRGLPEGWSLETVDSADPILRRLTRGEVVNDGAGRPGPLDTGTVYRFRTPAGDTVYYQPRGTDSKWAIGGRLRVWIDAPVRDLSARRLDDAFQSLGQIGMETAEATERDIQLLYLRKVAFKYRLDEELRTSVPEDLPVEEQIAKLRSELTARGRSLPTDLPGPVFEEGASSGWARWMDASMPDDVIDGLSLFHNLSDSEDTFFDLVLSGQSRGLISTVEKYRLGIARPDATPAGLSPFEDMKTGGANYVFTRVRRSDSRDTGLYFRGALLRDMDAITYDSDVFGSTKPDVISTRVVPSRHALEQLARGTRSDETIFKNGLSLDHIERIVVSSETKRRKVLAVFKKHGITELGGRPVAEIVEVS